MTTNHGNSSSRSAVKNLLDNHHYLSHIQSEKKPRPACSRLVLKTGSVVALSPLSVRWHGVVKLSYFQFVTDIFCKGQRAKFAFLLSIMYFSLTVVSFL